MFNLHFPRRTRSKPRSHPLFSALRYFIRPLRTQRKLYHTLPFGPGPTPSIPRPRKRLVFDPSLRQLRTERTLRMRPRHMKRTPILKPIKTGPATFDELTQEVQEVVQDLAACHVGTSTEEDIFIKQMKSLTAIHDFAKSLQAARESSQRGERDAPKLEKARRARAALATQESEASITARQSEGERSGGDPLHQQQPLKQQLPKPQSPYQARYQGSPRKTAEAARRRRVFGCQDRSRRGPHKDDETQILQAAYARQAAAANVERERQEALRKEKAWAEVLARNEALRKEREAEARVKEQAVRDAMHRAEMQRQEALRQHKVQVAQEALRQQERAQKEEQVREQARREYAARARAALEEARQAAMHRREEVPRQAACGQGVPSPATAVQDEENFRQRKDFIRQKLLAAIADAEQRGVSFTPFEPEPINAIALYELKWEELKANKAQLRHLTLTQLPWPVFELVTSPDAITYAAVHAFVFNPERPGAKNKTKRDRLRPEILKYHPDKFNNNILPLVHPDQLEIVATAADRAVKILNQLMELPI